MTSKEKRGVFRQPDQEAIRLAQSIIDEARYGALAVIDPETRGPIVTRVGLAPAHDRAPLLLVSDLSPHTDALRQQSACSLLLGDAPTKGDPLAFPRITLQANAHFVDKAEYRERYLTHYPKAQLYFDFADFHLVRLSIISALLNGGFGKAFKLSATDLLTEGDPST